MAVEKVSECDLAGTSLSIPVTDRSDQLGIPLEVQMIMAAHLGCPPAHRCMNSGRDLLCGCYGF